ncbi:MAG: ATP-dependent helicase [Lachnospiraceae bacterium]|nr:ATP-dependent helicase [Lachnospiraceae bacterium]
MELNKSQRLAVSFHEGAMLVLAGPGSGKTAVITNRVLSLVEDRGVPPEEILVITFSKAAAEEMKQRFIKAGSGRYYPVTFGTFHAIFFRIIRDAYDYNTSNIITDNEKNIYLSDAMREAGVTAQNEREFREKLSACISMLKNGQDIKEDCDHTAKDPAKKQNCGLPGIWEKAGRMLAMAPEKLRAVFDGYQKNIQNAGKIDFDDMMLLCLKIFRERNDVLKYWQGRFKYILIDEFQDINPLQYNLVKLLAVPENNIFAVGDDDQSIYGFRGASPKVMFEFEKDYKGCRRILLDVNYRSGAEITACSSKLIAANKERFKKRITSKKGLGSTVKRLHFTSFDEEMEHICRFANELKGSGNELSETAVLYRMNNQIRPLYNRLLGLNIPCRLREKLPDIFDHWIAQDMLSYLRIAGGGTDRADYIRVINRPVRYVGRDSFRSEKICLKDIYAVNSGKRYVTERLEKLEKDLDFIKRLDVTAALKYIRYGVGYGKYISEYARSKNTDETELFDIFDELTDSAHGFGTYREWAAHIEDMKEKTRLRAASGKNTGTDKEPDGIELMTFHRSKGLEFNTVFIIDANEGYAPGKRAETPEEIEEERRAFYVAATRARNELYICDCDDRLGRAVKPSRFISEMGLL